MELEILLPAVQFCKSTLGKTPKGFNAVEQFDLLQLFLKATPYCSKVDFR
jgi:hypothetical protein